MSRVFLVLIVVILVVLAVGRGGHSSSPASTGPPRTAAPAPVPPPAHRQAALSPPPLPAAAVTVQPPARESRTPTIDRMVRLEAKRRMAQSARFTYLDSLLVGADSTVRRWGDRDGRPISIAILLPDQPGAARLSARILAAARQWEALGLGVRFAETRDTASADVIVRWIDRFEQDRTGQADMQTGPDGAFFAGRVTIALKDRTNRALSDAEIEMIATHEFGHVLGLPHSGNRSDVMFPVATVGRISDRDRATATLLYSLPPGSLREPSS